MDGIGLSAVAIGGIFVYGGIKGYSPLKALANIVSGKNPNEKQSYNQLASPADAQLAIAGGAASGGATGNQAIGKMLAASYGWDTGQEWNDLVWLWNKESGWSNTADNPSSDAYGIPQALPYTKMPKSAWPAKAGGSSDATAQIQWGLQYIKDAYGSPSRARAHEEANNWY